MKCTPGVAIDGEDVNFLKQASLLRATREEKKRTGDVTGEAEAAWDLAKLCAKRNIHGEELVALQDAQNIFHDLGDHREVDVLIQQGKSYLRQALLAEAGEVLTSALEISQNYKDAPRELGSLRVLTTVYWRQRDWPRVESTLNSAQELQKEANDVEGEAAALDIAAQLFQRQLGRREDAISALQRSRALHRQLGNSGKEAIALQQLCRLYLNHRNAEEAKEFVDAALKLQIEFKDMQGLAHSYGLLSDVYRRMKRYDHAEMTLLRALAAMEQAPGTPALLSLDAGILEELGRLYFSQNKLLQAETTLRSARNLYLQVQQSFQEGVVLHVLGNVYETQGRVDQAREAYSTALSIQEAVWRETQDESVRAEMHRVQNMLETLSGKKTESESNS